MRYATLHYNMSTAERQPVVITQTLVNLCVKEARWIAYRLFAGELFFNDHDEGGLKETSRPRQYRRSDALLIMYSPDDLGCDLEDLLSEASTSLWYCAHSNEQSHVSTAST